MSHSNKSIYDLGKLKVQATGICCQNELVMPLKIRSIWLTVPYNKTQAHKPSSVHQFSDEHYNYKSKKKLFWCQLRCAGDGLLCLHSHKTSPKLDNIEPYQRVIFLICFSINEILVGCTIMVRC